MTEAHKETDLNGTGSSCDQSNIIVFPVANQSGAAAVPFSDFSMPVHSADSPTKAVPIRPSLGT